MNKRELLAAGVAAAAGWSGLGSARAQQSIKLTISAAHPVTTPWIRLLNTLFVPEVNRRVEALGKGQRIDWTEAYGGQLYKMNATLSSVGDAITDIGFVLVWAEPARLPLAQFSAALPFTTDDMRQVLDVVMQLHASVPELSAEWENNGTVQLGPMVADSYHLFTKEALRGYADLRGKRLSAPGPLGLWLRGSGAVAVDGSLASYYTDIQTGVSEGAVTIPSGILPMRLYEVAPHVALVGLGAQYAGAIAMNKDRFQELSPELQRILREVGQLYSTRLAEQMMQRYEESLKLIQEQGARQSTPVNMRAWPQEEREKWARALPPLASDWVRMQKSPAAARRIVQGYMQGLRQRGVTLLRPWDREL